MAHLCRCSFLSLLLFILTCSPSLAQPYPDPHYTPPLCNSSFPALLPSFITAQQILCKTQRYDDCTPASNATLIPALYAPEVSSYTAVLLKRNPSDRSTLRFTLTVPGAQGGSSWNASEYVFARYYDQNQAAPSSSGGPESYWAQWSAGSNPLNQFPIEIFADGEGSGPAYAGNKEFRTTVQVALVTGRPGASSNGSGYACMIVVEVIATCCGDIQPPVLVGQLQAERNAKEEREVQTPPCFLLLILLLFCALSFSPPFFFFRATLLDPAAVHRGFLLCFLPVAAVRHGPGEIRMVQPSQGRVGASASSRAGEEAIEQPEARRRTGIVGNDSSAHRRSRGWK